MIARYYDSVVGRFISPEPNVDQGGFDKGAGILAYNTYAYCANNPVNFFDSTGEAILTAILIGAGIGALLGGIGGWAYAKYFNIPKSKTWKYVIGGALIGAVLGGCAGYAVGSSMGSGAVLWSGEGMNAKALAFAKQNGLKTIGQTMRGKLLNAIGKKLPWSIMKPLWEAASARFVMSYAGKQAVVHVFITASAYGNMQSVFNSVEMQVIAELGYKIVWHFVK